MIIASILGLMYVGLSIDSRQSRKSDFVPPRFCHILRAILEIHDFHEQRNDLNPKLFNLENKLGNNRQSVYTNFIFSFPFEDFDATLGFNSGSLFIFM